MDAIECIMTRRSSGRLVEPAPSAGHLDVLLRAAMAGPDHGRLRPWRFFAVRGAGLERLGEVFAKAHAVREPTASAMDLDRTRAKPLRAPLIVAVTSSPRPSPKVPRWEQVASGRRRPRTSAWPPMRSAMAACGGPDGTARLPRCATISASRTRSRSWHGCTSAPNPKAYGHRPEPTPIPPHSPRSSTTDDNQAGAAGRPRVLAQVPSVQEWR